MSRIFLSFSLTLLLSVPLPGFKFLNKVAFALDKPILIKGRVYDAETKANLEFVSVILAHPKDSLPLQLAVTDARGEFHFQNIQPGNYLIRLSLLGFKSVTTPPFTLTGLQPEFQLDPISIHIDARTLGEITVQARAGATSYRLDKQTIYTENQLSGAGGSAADLLHKLPSVTQSPDGQIAIHGNTNLLVFINGKPSSIKGNELLENTSASEIKKIELITSPSAKYDASGSGGIINLITKRNAADGFNGNIMVAGDHLGGYSSDFLMNYKTKKISFFSGIDINRRRNEGDIDYVTHFLAAPTDFTESGIQKSQRTNTGIRAGADILPTGNDKILISSNFGSFQTNNDGNWQTMESTTSHSISSVSTDGDVRTGHYSGADATYEHKFGPTGKSISISALWNSLKYDDTYLNQVSDANGNGPMSQTTVLNKAFNNYQFNLDYNTPFGKAGNLEAGFQVTLNTEKESYRSTLTNPLPPVVTTQDTKYSGSVEAFYGTWRLKLKQLEFKAGVRGELLDRKLNTIQNSYPLHHFNLYPSLNVSYKIDSVQEFLFNFSRRTDQLKTIQLDPLPRWYDFYNVTVGNPNLQNEITSKVCADYLINLHKINLVNELYYYSTTDKIEVIRSLYRDNIIQNRFENMCSEKTFGLEINANWIVNTWLRLDEKLDFIDSRLEVNIDPVIQKRNYQQWYCVTSAGVILSPTLSVEADFSYYGPSLTAQSKISECYLGGISIRKSFLNKKLSVTFSGRDVMRLYKRTEQILGTDFSQTYSTHNKFPIRLSIAYKFNHFSRDERKNAKAPPAE